MKIDGQEVQAKKAIKVQADQEITLEAGAHEAHILMLQGKPIDEPVVQYGPFVANTQGEIRQAMLDFQDTQFGGWPWPSHEHVHPREKGRFAKYADGKVVEKG